MNDLVSIILRTKNEERWITSCLKAIFDQTYKNLEVILVDNQSTDKTVEKAKQFDIGELVEIKEYLPGNSLNEGIKKSKGKYIVCISAHCIPVNNKWIENLIRNFDDPDVAGVYGRQEPMSFSSDFDKRDLMIVFGLDRRVQEKDSFFHNANSMLRRDLWERFPFDDEITNIEDRLWAEQVLKAGFKLIYEPEASVYHYHGIHQDRDLQRCTNVVRILEMTTQGKGFKDNTLDIENMNIVAIIPVKGDPVYVDDVPLLKYTIDRAKDSKYINKIVVSTDSQATADLARELGAEVPFLRDASYSNEYVDLEKVYQYTLEEIEKKGIYPDLVVLLEVTFPFRSKNLLDTLIVELSTEGVDTILPSKEEFSSCWIDDEYGGYKRVDEGFIPRQFKHPVYVGLKGLGCVTYPFFIRDGNMIGQKVGLVHIKNPHSFLEVRDKGEMKLAEKLLKEWWENN